MYLWELLTYGTGSPTREGLLAVVAFIIAVLTAIILHEVAHGLVALWNGDDTAKLLGRLTLNPAKHINIIGALMFLLVGFGFANPVPVNPNNFRKKTFGMIAVSLAGVVTNMLLAFLFCSVYVFSLYTQIGISFYTNSYYVALFIAQLAQLLLTINVSFALFNILPLYPLDGYRLLACFVPQNKGFMRFLQRYSIYIILLLIVLSNFLPQQYSPLDLYIGQLGNAIVNGFIKFWALIFGVSV